MGSGANAVVKNVTITLDADKRGSSLNPASVNRNRQSLLASPPRGLPADATYTIILERSWALEQDRHRVSRRQRQLRLCAPYPGCSRKVSRKSALEGRFSSLWHHQETFGSVRQIIRGTIKPDYLLPKYLPTGTYTHVISQQFMCRPCSTDNQFLKTLVIKFVYGLM